jgi:5-deoxy-glucuronate isomerase
VRATTACEIALVGAANRTRFTPRLIPPDDVENEHRGKGMLDDTSYRIVRCVFDRRTAPPEARLVLGEVITLPGRWSSYPPHHHAQPEIYYYRFAPSGGYGHGEVGENVFAIREHDLLRITRERDHAQVAAPGYHMYYLWAIRHLDDRPYTGFEYAAEHAWLMTDPKRGER